LIVCCSTVESPSNVWNIENGALSHMSSVIEHFNNLKDTKIKLYIVLGDDTIVRAVGHSTISFQRELMSPLVFMDVLYVSGLNRNLILVSSIKHKGFRCSSKGHRSSFTLMGTSSLLVE
jgi:hypothetical protein